MCNYCIYAHISPSGKVYIGQTCKIPRRRWGKDGCNYLRKMKNGNYVHPLFSNAIIKYGWDNFQHKVLFDNLAKVDANLIEIDLIYYYQKIGMSYNIAAGGHSGMPRRLSDEQRADSRKDAQRRWRSSHRSECNAYMKEYRKTYNAPDYTEYYASYREEHRMELRVKNKAWYEANKDEVNARRRAKYAIKKQQINGNLLQRQMD